MKFKGMTLKDALEHVRKIKPTIEPNEGFAKQLISYEKSLFGKNSMEITDFEFNEDWIGDIAEEKGDIVFEL